MTNTFKDTRLLLRSKVQSSKPSSKSRQMALSSQKQNLLLDYIRKQKVRNNKNQTYNALRIRKENILLTQSADITKKKIGLQDSLVCRKIDCNVKQKQYFNQTLGNKKQEKEKKNLFITADVSSALRVLKKQTKMNTMGNSNTKENMMTQQDIDNLFEGTHPQQKASARNIQIDKIKLLLESEPDEIVQFKKPQKAIMRDYADSIKYLELEDGQDKLLAALCQNDFVKIQAQKGIDKTAKFKEQFIVGKQLGQGAYASVRLALYTSLNKKIAIKIYQKKKIKEPQRKKSVRRQIKILQQSNHKNIVKIFDVIQTNNHINLIMQYIPGVCLSSYLKNQPDCRLGQKTAKKMLKDMVQAVVYLHEQNICHRDIKLENILLDNELSPKLIDFGFATCILNHKKVKMFCGTPSFMAPQIVTKQQYKGPPADIWALGVVLFVILTGTFPFKGHTDKQLYGKICCSQYPNIDYLSKPAQNLIQKMMTVDPNQRITGQQILRHQWLNPCFQKKKSIIIQPQKHDFQTCKFKLIQHKKDQSSRERKFAVTQSGFNLQQMLRNVQQYKLSPRPIRNQNININFKPSTPLLQLAKRKSKPEIQDTIIFQKLTNKAYF